MHAETIWAIEAPVAQAPNTPLQGELFGMPVDANNLSVALWNNKLTFSTLEEENGWPRVKLIISVDLSEAEHEWVIRHNDLEAPDIDVFFMLPNDPFPTAVLFSQIYSMRLKVKKVGKELQGSIHLSLPDYRKSHLIGTFTTEKT